MNSAFCVAVHALICLNRRQEQLSSEELARSICTNPARVRKIMAGLKRADWWKPRRGMRVATALWAIPPPLH